MNRRSFISRLGAAVAAFTVLPAATTYARTWKATPRAIPYNPQDFTGKWAINPAWETAEYETRFLYSPNFIAILQNRDWEKSGDLHVPSERTGIAVLDDFPIRYKCNKEGRFEQVQPFIQIT